MDVFGLFRKMFLHIRYFHICVDSCETDHRLFVDCSEA